MSKQFSAGALLIAALFAACAGKSSPITGDGSAGSGGKSTADGGAGSGGTSTADGGAGSGGKSTADGGAGSGGKSTGVAGQAGVGDAQPPASDADGGDDLATDALGAGGTAPPRVAANGVPIPPPALAPPHPPDPCVLLDVHSVACSTSNACEPVSCDCGGHPVVVEGCRGIIDKCVMGISCPAACAMGPNALTNVIDCLYRDPMSITPVCKSDADCKQTLFPYKCVVPPNAATGECVTGATGSPCLKDVDCQSRACVVTAEGLGLCGGGVGACNTDEQCSAGATTTGAGATGRCVVPQGAFVGHCTAGAGGSPCLTQRDCQPSVECGIPSQGGSSVCGPRRDGAPCYGDADCDSGFFCGPGGKCSDGMLGAVCRNDGSGCVAGLHCSRDPFSWVCVGSPDAGGQ
jgi:hypothetical protein